jgi:hypothetical protein
MSKTIRCLFFILPVFLCMACEYELQKTNEVEIEKPVFSIVTYSWKRQSITAEIMWSNTR